MNEKMHIFLSASIVALAVVGILYGGVHYWNAYKQKEQIKEQILKDKEVALLAKEEEENLEQELKEKLLSEEIASLRQELLSLKTKSEKESKLISSKPDTTAGVLTDVVKQWSPRVAHVECEWKDSQGNVYQKGSGSATLVYFSNAGVKAISSKHVFLNSRKDFPATCKVEPLNSTSYSVNINDDTLLVAKDEDWAYLSLPQDLNLVNITKQKVRVCTSVESGDELVVLGYPKIGSKTGLTVTEGIVSGEDGSYYITSAKIDKGNSGGAAILVKNNCYLGIPSASVVGIIESLGRILKAKFVIGN